MVVMDNATLLLGILANLAIVAAICGAIGVAVHWAILGLVKRVPLWIRGRAVKLLARPG
jgi:hypothetical protein